jgi:iron complex transport system substrate-binding protein
MAKNTALIIAIVAIIAIAAACAAFVLMNNGGSSDDKGDGDAIPAVKTLPSTYARLNVLGNANADDKIDSSDVNYVKDVIGGKRTANFYCDVNQDGVIDKKDVDDLQKIVDLKPSKLFYINAKDSVESVNVPINNMVVGFRRTTEMVAALGCIDKVVGITEGGKNQFSFVGFTSTALNNIVNKGQNNDGNPNSETLLALYKDYQNKGGLTVVGDANGMPEDYETIFKGLPVDVVRLPCTEGTRIAEGMITLAYMLSFDTTHASTVKSKIGSWTSWNDTVDSEISAAMKKVASKDKGIIVLHNYTLGVNDIRLRGEGLSECEISKLCGCDNMAYLIGTGADAKYATLNNEAILEMQRLGMTKVVGEAQTLFQKIIAAYDKATNDAERAAALKLIEPEADAIATHDAFVGYNGSFALIGQEICNGPEVVLYKMFVAAYFLPELSSKYTTAYLNQEYQAYMKSLNPSTCLVNAEVFLLPESLDNVITTPVTDDPTRETAKADGRLWIIGNANMDDVLDEKDVEWIEKIIKGKANEVLFNSGIDSEWAQTARMADANQDGVVDKQDIAKVRSMIASTSDSPKQKNYYVDVDGAVNSMHIPVKTIFTGYVQNSKQLQTLHALDMVTVVDKSTYNAMYAHDKLGHIDEAHVYSYSGTFNPEAETVIGFNPDIIVTGTRIHYCVELEKTLPSNRTNMDIVRISSWEDGKTIEGTLTLGFMIGKYDEAKAYADWADKWFGEINSKVATLSSDQIVKVLSPRGAYNDWNVIMNGPRGGKYETTLLAGADNIITRNLTSTSTNITVTDEWVKAQKDLDFIIPIVYGGLENSSRHVNSDPVYPEGHDYNNRSFYEEAVKYWSGMTNAYGTQIHVIDNLVSQGTTYVIGAVYMAKWFYPELFADMNPDAIFQEFMDKFFEYDFDVASFQAKGGIGI